MPAAPRADGSTDRLRSLVVSTGRGRELVERALGIGADPHDSSDERFRKRMLVGIALIILPAGLLWGYLYWVADELGAALLPWGYVVCSIASLGVFARTKSFDLLRTAQLLLILVVPAALAVVLGGLDESSDVVLWSLLAPLGAVAFGRPERAWRWFVAFVAAVVLAIPLAEVVRPDV